VLADAGSIPAASTNLYPGTLPGYALSVLPMAQYRQISLHWIPFSVEARSSIKKNRKPGKKPGFL